MTGSGNDFVMLDGRHSLPEDWSADDIRAVCARGTGLGADGLVLVSPGGTAGAVRMTYFNSDGSRAAMCGNAALCSTRLAARLGLADGAGMRLETDAGTYESRCLPEGERAELHLAPIAAPSEPALGRQEGEERVGFAVVGVPHLVVLVQDLEAAELMNRGRVLRSAKTLGDGGANVNFIAATGDPMVWAMRTYERGIEAETLACGTGAVAAACLLQLWGLRRLPTTILTRSGLRLGVRARPAVDGRFEDVWLEGQARLVFRGVLT